MAGNREEFNFDFNFNANTQKASRQLKELSNEINQILRMGSTELKIKGIDTKAINEGKQALSELDSILQRSIDKDGKLNLNSLTSSLTKANKSIGDFGKKINALGPEGQAAFQKITNSIMQAQVPIKKSGELIEKFRKTLANTFRWQISSAALNSIYGTIQGAYHYAQQLDKSLNSIRIVTGQSADQMAKFAKEANQAAQALSTTTTAYTNASLIYYQQGLSDDEVKRRTETTIKLSNVTRQAAQDVSSQMTAIWNNFDDGTKSLEFYADAITALGAKTASSSSEIAEGLEKFASVANTVGLSYEYATAALATVTAQTRQSADIVGNAFKTLFARIESLKLGETLDDGTDLNKYSEALKVAGINVKDASGDLKEMDDVLDETGAKWKTLSKDQQVALAQTVGGVRQYTQFIALMDNYDIFKKNVTTAKTSSGELEKQQKTYEESWEAAEERVAAKAEEIYSKLFRSDDFITLNNILEDFLDLVSKLVDSLGGLGGVLGTLGLTLTTIFKDKGAKAIDGFIDRSFIGRKRIEKLWEEAAGDTEIKDSDDARIRVNKTQKAFQAELIHNPPKSEEEREARQRQIDNVGAMGEAMAQAREKQQEMINQARLNKNVALSGIREQKNEAESFIKELQTFGNRKPISKELKDKAKYLKDIGLFPDGKKGDKALDEIINSQGFFNTKKAADSLQGSLNALKPYKENAIETIERAKEDLSKHLYTGKRIQNVLDKTASYDFSDEAGSPDQEFVDNFANRFKSFTDEELGNFAKGNGDKSEEIAELIKNIRDGKIELNNFNEKYERLRILMADDKSPKMIEDIENKLKGAKVQGEQLEETLQDIQHEANKMSDIDIDVNETESDYNDAVENLKNEMGVKEPKTLKQRFKDAKNAVKTPIKSVKEVVKNASAGETVMGLTGVLTAGVAAGESGSQLGASIKEGDVSSAIGSGVSALTEIGTTFATMGPVVGSAIASFTILKTVLSAIPGDLEQAKEKFENLSQSSENLSEAVGKAQDDYNNLQGSLDAFQEASKAVKDLATGTQEWKEAILDLNYQMINLINQYPDLIKYVEKENGVYTLSKEKQQEFLDAQLESMKIVSDATLNLEIRKNKAKIDLDTEDLKKNTGNNEGFWGSWWSLDQTVFGGGAYEGKFDQVGEGIVQGLLSAVRLQIKNGEFNEQEFFSKEKLKEMYGSLDDQDIEDIINKKEDFINTAANIENTNKLNDQQLDQMAQNLVMNSEEVTTKYTDALTFSIKDKLQGKMDEEFNLLDTLDEEDLKNRFLNNIVGAKENAEGDVEYGGHPMDEDQMKSVLATQYAYAKIEENDLKQINENLNKISESYPNLSNDLMNVLIGKEGNIGNISENDFNKLSTVVENMSDATAENLGINKEQLEATLENNKDQINEKNEEIVNGIDSDIAKEAYRNIGNGLKQLNAAGKQIVADTIDQAHALGADEIIKQITKALNNSRIDGQKYAEALKEIDWNTVTINEYRKKMVELDNRFNLSDDEIQNLINSMKTVATSAQDVAKNFGELSDKLKSISKVGDTISSEIYTELPDELKSFFRMTLDGTYELTENALDFKKTVQSIGIRDISNSRDKANKDKTNKERIVNDANYEARFNAFENAYEERYKYKGSSKDTIKQEKDNFYVENKDLIDGNKREWVNNQLKKQGFLNFNAEVETENQFVTRRTEAEETFGEQFETYSKEAKEKYENLGEQVKNAPEEEEVKNKQFETGYDDKGFITTAGDQINALIDVFKANSDKLTEEDNERVNAIQEHNEQGSVEREEIEFLHDLKSKIGDTFTEDFKEDIKKDEEEEKATDYAIASSATSKYELDEMKENEDIQYQDSYDDAMLQMHKEERAEDLDPNVIKEYSEYLQDISESSEDATLGTDKLNKELAENEDIAQSLSTQIMRMNKGVSDLSKNWGTWSSMLKKSTKGYEEYFEAMEGTKDALADLLDLSADSFSADFVESLAKDTKSMELMEKAAKGDGDAIDELRAKALDDIVANIDLDETKFEGKRKKFEDEIESIKGLLDDQKLELGVELDSSDFDKGETDIIEKMNNLIQDAGLSVDEVNQILSGMGYEATFSEDEEDIEYEGPPIVTTHHTVTEPQRKNVGGSVPGEERYVSEYDEITTQETQPGEKLKGKAAISAIATYPQGKKVIPKINKIHKKASGSANNSSKQNAGKTPSKGKSGGGSGTTAKRKDIPKKEKDPYWDVNNKIKKVDNTLEKLNDSMTTTQKLQDHLWGSAASRNLDNQNKLLEKRNKEIQKQLANQKETYKIQKQELKETKNKLEELLKKSGSGIKVKYNKNGEITNFKDLEEKENNRRIAAYKKFNKQVEDERKKNKAKEDADIAKINKDKNMGVKEKSEKKTDIKNTRKKADEKLDKEVEKREKEFSEWKEYIEKIRKLIYEDMPETINKMRDLIEEQLNNYIQKVENNFKKIQNEFQLKLDKNEIRKQFKEVLHNFDKDFTTQWEKFSINKIKAEIDSEFDIKNGNEFYGTGGTFDILSQRLNGITSSINSFKTVGKAIDEEYLTLSDAVKDYNEVMNQVLDKASEWQQKQEEAYSNYNSQINQYISKLQDVETLYSNINDELEFSKQLIDLVYGEKSYDKLNKYYEAQKKLNDAQITTLKTNEANLSNVFDKELNRRVKELNKNKKDNDLLETADTVKSNRNLWSQAMYEIDNQLTNEKSKQRKLTLDNINLYKEEASKNIDKIAEDLEKNIFGKGAEAAKADWDRVTSYYNDWYDGIEAAYQIQTYANKIDEQISKSSILTTQQKLKKLRDDELKFLKTKEKLSKTDVELLNARYEIMLKEIALENAQNQKNSMKLVRDTSGNWTYQYVADPVEEAKAKQELADASYNYYEIANKATQNSMTGMLDTVLNYNQKRKEFFEQYNLNGNLEEGQIITDEQQAELNKINKEAQETFTDYFKQFIEYSQETGAGAAGIMKLFDLNSTEFQGLPKGVQEFFEIMGKDASFTEQRSKILAGDNDALQSWLDEILKGNPAWMEKMFSNLSDTSLESIIDWLQTNSLSYLKNLETYTTQTKDAMKELLGENIDINDYMGSAEEKLALISTQNEVYYEDFSTSLDETLNILSTISSVLDTIEDIISTRQAESDKYNSEKDIIDETALFDSGELNDYMNKKKTKKAKKGYAQEILASVKEDGMLNAESLGLALSGLTSDNAKAMVNAILEDENHFGLTHKDLEDLDEVLKDLKTNEDIKPSVYKAIAKLIYTTNKKGEKVLKFDTGGYTGEWDTTGRLALLHQKELVLNQADTENMLDIVSITRDLMKTSFFDEIAKKLDMLKVSTDYSTASKISEPQSTSSVFNITAEFPNANDVSTIQQAILTLPNLASQYVGQR